MNAYGAGISVGGGARRGGYSWTQANQYGPVAPPTISQCLRVDRSQLNGSLAVVHVLVHTGEWARGRYCWQLWGVLGAHGAQARLSLRGVVLVLFVARRNRTAQVNPNNQWVVQCNDMLDSFPSLGAKNRVSESSPEETVAQARDGLVQGADCDRCLSAVVRQTLAAPRQQAGKRKRGVGEWRGRTRGSKSMCD